MTNYDPPEKSRRVFHWAMQPFSPVRFSRYAADLSQAVYELSRESMSIADLRAAVKDIPGAGNLTLGYAANGNQVVTVKGKSVEVAPMASNEEIRLALQSQFVTGKPHMTVSGYEPGQIRARLNALKQAGKTRRDSALSKLEQAGKKHEAVSEEIEKVAAQIEKEADDALQEFASFTNGGPE